MILLFCVISAAVTVRLHASRWASAGKSATVSLVSDTLTGTAGSQVQQGL